MSKEGENVKWMLAMPTAADAVVHWMTTEVPAGTPILVLMRGPPGSGKSTTAQQIKSALESRKKEGDKASKGIGGITIASADMGRAQIDDIVRKTVEEVKRIGSEHGPGSAVHAKMLDDMLDAEAIAEKAAPRMRHLGRLHKMARAEAIYDIMRPEGNRAAILDNTHIDDTRDGLSGFVQFARTMGAQVAEVRMDVKPEDADSLTKNNVHRVPGAVVRTMLERYLAEVPKDKRIVFDRTFKVAPFYRDTAA